MSPRKKKKVRNPSVAIPPSTLISPLDQPSHTGPVTTITHKSQFTTGPLPPPETLAKYNDIHPGLADRIVTLAESEAAHRRSKELDILAAQIGDAQASRRERGRGQAFAFLIAVIFALAGTYVSTHGAPWPGALVGGTGVTAIVLAFLGQRRGETAHQPKGPKDEEDGQE